jgi:hypothetical protein
VVVEGGGRVVGGGVVGGGGTVVLVGGGVVLVGGGDADTFATWTLAVVWAELPFVAAATTLRTWAPLARVVVSSRPSGSPLKRYGAYCSLHIRAPSM